MNRRLKIIAILLMVIAHTLFNGLGVSVTAMAEEADTQPATSSPAIIADLPEEKAEIEESTVNSAEKIEAKESTVEHKQKVAVTADTAVTTQAAYEIKENILTGIVLKDENGNVIHAQENPDLHPVLGSAVEISYTWALKNNHGFKAGDYFSFTLPKELAVYNDIDPQPLLFGNGSVGTFTVTKEGKVTMTFNSEIETRSNVNGTLKLWTEFSEKLIGSVTKEIITPIMDDRLVKIPVIFQPKQGPAIDKEGEPNTAYNAETIDWTVDFNKQLAKIDQAILKDPIQTGQALQPGSIKLYQLDVQLDGSVIQGELVDPNEYMIEKTDDSDFQLRFKTEPLRNAYRVTYTTTITNDDQTSFVNEAVLTGNNFIELKAKATVTVKRGTALAKSSTAYDAKNQTIEWAIQYNWNEKAIAKDKAVLTDYFNDTQKLVDGSVKVFRVTIDSSGNAQSSTLIPADQYTITPKVRQGQEGFELKFKEGIHEAYKIEYQTQTKERVFENERIDNTIVSGTGQTASGSRNISQGILTKIRTTNASETNYKDKTTQWHVTFNKDEFYMNNVKLTDTFPNKGLLLLPDTLKIERAVGEGRVALIAGVDYELTNNGDAGFELTFLKPINEAHYISYLAEFDYDARADKKLNFFTNKAQLDWIDEAGEEKTKDVTDRFTPDNYTQNNGFKNGSYNAVTKEITWNIGVNYNLKTISNPVVEDYLLNGQELVKDSIKVFKMELTGGTNGTKTGTELTLDQDYTLSLVNDKDGNPGWRITFKEKIDSPYLITFKAGLNDKLIKNTYNNTAKLLDGTTEEAKLTANVTVQFGGEYVSKAAAQDNKVINWTININRGQSHISKAKIIDTPSSNQILLEDSFHLYSTKIAANGNVTKDPDTELKRGVDYTLKIKTDDQGSQSFEIQFLHDIDSAFILNYQSYINAENGATLTNSVKLEGEQITTETTESTGTIIVKVSGGSGTGSGETGSLEVTKVDSVSGQLLKGATFTLYDSEGKMALRTLTTGENGKIMFTNLLYNDYLLKEDTAPAGYLVGIIDHQMVTVNAKETKVTIKNKKILRAVELTKVDHDQETQTLQGAQFALFFKEGKDFKKIAELETDENGVLYKDQLEPGEYQLVEIAAPFGYQLDTTPQLFTIGEKQTEKIKLTMKNHLSLGAVELQKLDKDHPEVSVSDAVFTLQDATGKTLQTDLKTDGNGKLTVNNIKPGNYQFVETKAPFGYELDAAPITFTIEKGQTETLQVTAFNELTTGSVELTKVDHDNQEQTLSGAEFELQDANGKTLKTGLKTNQAGKLVVDKLKPGSYQFIETKAPVEYQLDPTPIKFIIEKGQKAAVQITATNELTPGDVELIKVDKDQPSLRVANAEFELQDAAGKSLQKGLVTDMTGTIVVKNLKPGNYQFIETKAPFGYVLDSIPIKFTIVKGQVVKASVLASNELATGAVELTKVDQDNQQAPVAGAEFSLQDGTGKTLQSGLVTNENGKIVVADLKPGNYQFVETRAPFGYDLDPEPIKFTIVKGQTEMAQVTTSNELTTGAVELIKIDDDDQKLTLSGAEFKLQDASGKTLKTGLTTGPDGRLSVKDLKPGYYQFVETKAPFGYNLNVTPIQFAIVKGQTESLVLVAANAITTGGVELTKVDKDDPQAAVVGAEFELQDLFGKTLQTGLITDQKGKLVVKDLKPGNYQFVETKAPFGYELDATPIKFMIVKGQVQLAKMIVTNELTTGAVEITKVDKDNPQLVLAGAEFELQDTAGKTLQKGLNTDENGKIVVKDLKPGDYQFVETKAPAGYEIDRTAIKFTIEKGQMKATAVIAVNTKTKAVTVDKPTDPQIKKPVQSGSKYTLPNTATDNFNILFVGAVLLFVGTSLLLINRRKRSIE
jgi:LPXTG-motif cell wall-anchored protein